MYLSSLSAEFACANVSATDTTGLGTDNGATLLEGIFFDGTVYSLIVPLNPARPEACADGGVGAARSVRLGHKEPLGLRRYLRRCPQR